MFKYIILFIFSITLLEARVNPFFAPKDDESLSVTTNTPEQHVPLKQATLSLPSSARIIKEVSIEYINLDGSTEHKSIALDNSIDWHQPIVVSQANVKGSVLNGSSVESREIKHDNKNRELADFKFISFSSKGKTLSINTKDQYIRNFLTVSPYRIVVDFKAEYNFRSISKLVSENIIKSIRIGNHNGFYRVVLELDGQYKYSFTQEGNSYIIHFN